MARTTLEELKIDIKSINEEIKGSGSKLILGQRYGYKAVDEGYENLEKFAGVRIKRTLISGISSGEVETYLRGVSDGIRLYQKKLEKVV
jgi:hypothetical protein